MGEIPPNQLQCQKHILHIYSLKCLMNIWKAFSNHKKSFKLSPSLLLWVVNHILKRLLQFLHLLNSYMELIRTQFARWRQIKKERERKGRKNSDSFGCIQEKNISYGFAMWCFLQYSSSVFLLSNCCSYHWKCFYLLMLKHLEKFFLEEADI